MFQERANLIQKALLQEKYRPNTINIDYDVPTKQDMYEIKQKSDYYDPEKKRGSNNLAADEDYEELVERLRVADYLYTEYSLEEVIYQLAKVMFSQSLTRGSAEAQQAFHKFTTFLER